MTTFQLVACEARGRGYNRREEQDDEVRRFNSQEGSDFGIQQLKYKPHVSCNFYFVVLLYKVCLQDTYDQNTGRGRRIGNDQRPRDSRVHQQSGSQEVVNGIYVSYPCFFV